MKDTEYAYAVAYMKTLENKMLTKNDFEALITAPDFSQALKLVTDKGYGNGADGELTIEKLLEGELKKIWHEAEECLPKEAPLDILKYKNDFHNLKTILKAFITNAPWQNLMLTPAVVDPELIFEAVKNADFSDLPDFLSDAAREGYAVVTREHDGQKTEIHIDKAAYEKMRERAKGNSFLTEWIEKNIVFANLSIALRTVGKTREFIENAFIPTSRINLSKLSDAVIDGKDSVLEYITAQGFADGAEAAENSLGDFEKWCDNKKMEFLRSVKNSFFGFEPVMAFILGKEAEIQAVRIILSGHKNSIPSEIIRERLRDLYV